jgi:hypothetical protein
VKELSNTDLKTLLKSLKWIAWLDYKNNIQRVFHG